MLSEVWLAVGGVCLGLAVLGVLVIVVGRWLRPSARWGNQDARVTLLALAAVGVFATVTGWLFGADPLSDKANVLRTSGLAAGSLVALHALWLNDRRRRVDEQRQALDSRRAEHDRERAAEERFLKSVELLGHDADQVRVGALHALAGLARNRPDYTQTVLDVFCSYLRRPFPHPDYSTPGDERTEWTDEARRDADRGRQVRLTAQRLMAELLPEVGDPLAPAYDLDLTGAGLEYLDLSERQIGRLTMHRAVCHQTTALYRTVVHGSAWLTGVHLRAGLVAYDARFGDKAWFSGFRADGPVDFARTWFAGETKFAGAVFQAEADFADSRFAVEPDWEETTFHAGWAAPPEAG